MSSKNLLTIDELSQASGLTKRTIRYYVNSGLLDRPTGETKNARYDASHLEQIRNIKALQEQGYTLARILEIKRRTHQEVLNRREIGEPLTVIEIPVDPGISIVFRQEICGLTQPQMIKLSEVFLEVLKSVKNQEVQEKYSNESEQH